ncbi:MAG: PilZ domain-containing protein [Enterobacterales bacterium]|nr:PilZ domain-containing protein [Enterobacterales bacterium]
MQSTNNTDDRREYFRIKNKILMRFEIANKDQPPKTIELESNKHAEQISLLQRISKIQDLNDVFNNDLSAEHYLTKDHLEAINQQLSCLSHDLLTAIDHEYRDLMEVDISGGGLRFESDQALAKGQTLNMEIILVPEFQAIHIFGQVVNSEMVENQKNQHRLAISFIKIKEADRDAIIGHIFKTQSKQLRACKESEK